MKHENNLKKGIVAVSGLGFLGAYKHFSKIFVLFGLGGIGLIVAAIMLIILGGQVWNPISCFFIAAIFVRKPSPLFFFVTPFY